MLFFARNVIMYIGETSTPFNLRFNNHKCCVRNKKTENNSVAEHFNLPNHSIDDMVFTILQKASENESIRKAQESRLIFKFKTFEYPGLNRDFVFL